MPASPTAVAADIDPMSRAGATAARPVINVSWRDANSVALAQNEQTLSPAVEAEREYLTRADRQRMNVARAVA
jgi:hypothetical protein